MSIRFACEHCQRPIEVEDALQGRRGKCKHCGLALVVPGGESPKVESSLRLKAPDDAEPIRAASHLLEKPGPLTLQSAVAEPEAWSKAVSRPDELLASTGSARYAVAASSGDGGTHDSGSPPAWMRLPSRSARLVARGLRKSRDFLYLISVASLVAVLLGFLFKAKVVMHLGAAAIVIANGGMLGIGLAYLVTLPFKESLRHGLACLLIPGYVVYYWTTRWAKMRRPVWNTLCAFVPILLTALAYVFYEKEPALKSTLDQQLPRLEQRVDEDLDRTDLLLDGSTTPDKLRSSRRPAPP